MSLSESRILKLALEHLQNQRREIDLEIAELRNKVGHQAVKRRGRPAGTMNEPKVASVKGGRKKGRKMSAAQKEALSEKMKQRWAERKKSGRE